MEHINFTEASALEKGTPSRFSLKEWSKKVLKLGGVPVTLATFLASCGTGKEGKPVTAEMLSSAKEKGAVVIDSATLSSLESIIQTAKDEGKTTFLFEEDHLTVDVDTVEHIVQTHHTLTDVEYNTAMQSSDGVVQYKSYSGTGYDNPIEQLSVDEATGVVITSIAKESGGGHEVYGITEDGSMNGEYSSAEEVAQDFSKHVQYLREKIQ